MENITDIYFYGTHSSAIIGLGVVALYALYRLSFLVIAYARGDELDFEGEGEDGDLPMFNNSIVPIEIVLSIMKLFLINGFTALTWPIAVPSIVVWAIAYSIRQKRLPVNQAVSRLSS